MIKSPKRQTLKGSCGFCGKLAKTHSADDARFHLVMSCAMTAIQKRVKNHLENDRKIMKGVLRRQLSKQQYSDLVSKLRYPL